MRGPLGTSVTITVLREGWTEPKDFSIERAAIQIKSVRSKTLEPRIGYVRITQFTTRTPEELGSAMESLEKPGKLEGLVVDLRNSVGLSSFALEPAVTVCERSLASGVIATTPGRARSEKKKLVAHNQGKAARGE